MAAMPASLLKSCLHALCLWLMAVTLTSPASAQQDLSTSLESTRAKYHLPGCTAMVVQGGRVVASGQAGVRQMGRETPLAVNDSINIGSCTKSMTAVIAGRLVDRGLIKWETRVRDLFSEYATFHPAFAEATLEQLLSHRAGVEGGEAWEKAHWPALKKRVGSVQETRRWVVQMALRDAPTVPPGGFCYSNQGVTVAGAMLELASGQAWEDLLQQEIFRPLSMKSASYGVVSHGELPPAAPVGHALTAATAQPTPNAPWSPLWLSQYQAAGGPAGSVNAPMVDWARFLSVFLGRAPGYLQPATLQKMVTPVGADGYALGIFAAPRAWAGSQNALNHRGVVFGQTSVFWVAPARDVIFLAYTNCRSTDETCAEALEEIMQTLVGQYAAPETGLRSAR